jgi:hypothetical protein
MGLRTIEAYPGASEAFTGSRKIAEIGFDCTDECVFNIRRRNDIAS